MRLAGRLLTVAAALLLAVPSSGAADKRPWTRAVYIVNQSTRVTDAELEDALPAFQASVSDDLRHYWNVDARLVLADAPPARAWTLTLSDEPDCVFCAGYHGVRMGVPFGMVFPDDELPWTVVLTHELQELLVDPMVNRAALDATMFRLTEVSDPVESPRYAYARASASGAPVLVSDFVFPRYYESRYRRGPFDFAGHVRHPLEILTDGYLAEWSGSGWSVRFADGTTARRRLAVFPTAHF